MDILPSKPIKSYCYKTDPYGVLKDKSKIVQFSHFCLLLLQNDNYVAFFFSPLKQYDDDDDDDVCYLKLYYNEIAKVEATGILMLEFILTIAAMLLFHNLSYF